MKVYDGIGINGGGLFETRITGALTLLEKTESYSYVQQIAAIREDRTWRSIDAWHRRDQVFVTATGLVGDDIDLAGLLVEEGAHIHHGPHEPLAQAIRARALRHLGAPDRATAIEERISAGNESDHLRAWQAEKRQRYGGVLVMTLVLTALIGLNAMMAPGSVLALMVGR